jgi:hypothetical protein
LQAVLHNEAEILERDTGRLLPRSLGIWEHDPSGLPVLVMERLEGRQPSTPADVVAVLDALAEAAERGTFDAHGDVKVEHIFIDGQRVRLCDPAPRFAAADRRGFTPLYNPYGYIGPAADVAACATVLRYLPGGGTAGWRWCDEVLRGPAPPPFASSHRAALDELRKALSANEPPPPGWTVPPLPERTGYFSRSAQPGPPVLPVPPPDPPSDGGYLPPVLTPTHTWPPSFPPPLPPPPPRSRLTYSAVALALHASSVIEAEDPADALFAPATPEAARSLTVLLDAMVTVTRGLAADGGSPVEYPGVTLLVQPGRLGGVEGVLARMMSMVPKHDVPLGDPLGAALGSAWNAAARLRLGEALAALDDAADLLHHVPHQGSAATATTDLVETARHIMSTLAVLRSHVERRLHGLS